MAKMPNREVIITSTAGRKPSFISSMDGFMANMYGTMKAAIASLVALTPVFIGSDLAMAEPA